VENSPLNVIDRISKWVAWATAMLVPLLILELVYDTIARYVFNAPSEWSFDITYMMYGAIFMGAAAHTLNIDEHVRVETWYGKVSKRRQAMIDAFGYVVFFFPAVSTLVYYGALFALRSWHMREIGGDSMWQPPIYPFKAVLPLAAGLLLLQGLAQFYRCMTVIMSKENVDTKS
jgi:TRAP-type mannitol/chloroaromatic compound transport system permease small subunit